VAALVHGVVAGLLDAPVGQPLAEAADRLTRRLVEDRALREDAAGWAVATWASALKLAETSHQAGNSLDAPGVGASVWEEEPAACPQQAAAGAGTLANYREKAKIYSPTQVTVGA
jgi:hypothetical protein